jgi:hypothetical protein
MKLNWGHGISIALGAFAILMLGFLYNSFQFNHDMVSENYYQEELVYQDKIDQKSNAKKDGKNIVVREVDGQVVVQFELTDTAVSEGTLKFMRPSDQSLDLELPIALNTEAQQSIPKSLFQRGSYTLKASWKVNSTDYYFVKNIFIQ